MEKYIKILKKIDNEKIDMTKLYIASCVMENMYNSKNIDLVLYKLWQEQLEYIYDLWNDIDSDICLARLCDIVTENWEKIQKEEMTDDDITTLLFV